MRKIALLFIILFFASSCFALEELYNWVNDEANIIDSSHEQLIVSELEHLKKNTSVEMAVATVKTTGDIPIEEYSINLAHNVLGEKGKDNGLLILVAVDDRKWRIEVGYGLEPYLPDAKVGRIGRDIMVPYFEQEKYGEGILQGVKTMKAILMNETGYELTAAGTQTNAETVVKVLSPLIVFGIWILIIYLLVQKKRHKEDEIFRGAALAAILFGRGGRGGFSGGSFGGFGGGGFGGGGAGGGW